MIDRRYISYYLTSQEVYPAANLLDYVTPETSFYLINPNQLRYSKSTNIKHIQFTTTSDMSQLIELLARSLGDYK